MNNSKRQTPSRVRIGVSGWLYPPWRGAFYPPKLPQRKELGYIGDVFDTVEINSTFYRLQSADSFKRWRDAVPPGFLFSVKGSRFITHMLRLRDCRPALANFFASGLLRLGPKLGPVLWQLPPNFKFDRDLIARFLDQLPDDTTAAANLAREHLQRKKSTWTRTDKRRPIRHALEIRHESFLAPAFIDLLRARNVALVCADTVDWPKLMDLTADFAYCRLHGSSELYFSNYGPRALAGWAKRFVAWSVGDDPPGKHVARRNPGRPRDVFVYFDNTAKIHAPENALDLARRVAKLTRS